MGNDFAMLTCAYWHDLPAAVAALTEDLATRVAALQDASKRPWDYFRLEIWEDSGRIIAFPARSGEFSRVDVAGCVITCDEIASDLAKLDGLDLPDETHERRVDALVDRAAHFVRACFPPQFPFTWRLFDQDGVDLTSTASRQHAKVAGPDRDT